MSRAVCKTELYRRRRSAGLCVQCGADAGGKSKCVPCAEKDKAARQRRRASRKTVGICTACSQPVKEGRVLCQVCIDKRSKVSMARYHRNKAAGVCPYCGNATDGEFMCESCRMTHRKGSSAWYRRQRQNSCCVQCGDSYEGAGVHCAHCREAAKRAERRRYAQNRASAFEAYGGPKCACCGETDVDVLQIDHINGGGTQHRKAIGEPIAFWLRKQGYPEGFQVLCANCNTKKAREADRMALSAAP